MRTVMVNRKVFPFEDRNILKNVLESLRFGENVLSVSDEGQMDLVWLIAKILPDDGSVRLRVLVPPGIDTSVVSSPWVFFYSSKIGWDMSQVPNRAPSWLVMTAGIRGGVNKTTLSYMLYIGMLANETYQTAGFVDADANGTASSELPHIFPEAFSSSEADGLTGIHFAEIHRPSKKSARKVFAAFFLSSGIAEQPISRRNEAIEQVLKVSVSICPLDVMIVDLPGDKGIATHLISFLSNFISTLPVDFRGTHFRILVGMFPQERDLLSAKEMVNAIYAQWSRNLPSPLFVLFFPYNADQKSVKLATEWVMREVREGGFPAGSVGGVLKVPAINLTQWDRLKTIRERMLEIGQIASNLNNLVMVVTPELRTQRWLP